MPKGGDKTKIGKNLSLTTELIHRINECVGEGYPKKIKGEFNISIDLDLLFKMDQVYKHGDFRNFSQFVERCVELGIKESGTDIKNKSFTDVFEDFAYFGLKKLTKKKVKS